MTASGPLTSTALPLQLIYLFHFFYSKLNFLGNNLTLKKNLNMTQTQVLLRIFLILSLFCASSFALKCYVCNSATQPNCGNSPPPEEYLVDCSRDSQDDNQNMKMEEPPTIAEEVKVADKSEMETKKDTRSFEEGLDVNTASKLAQPLASNASFDSDEKELTLNSTESMGHKHEHEVKRETRPTFLATNAGAFPTEATYCRKSAYHIPKQENGPNMTFPKSVRMVRSCGFIREEHKEGEQMKTGCKWIGTDGVQLDQCTCTGDGCNSASLLNSLKIQTLILLGSMTAGFFFIL